MQVSPTVLMASGVDENYMPSKQTLIIAACLCAERPRANTVVIPTAAEAEKDSGWGDEVSQVEKVISILQEINPAFR